VDHIPEILKKWLSPLKNNLPTLYLVGGAVRDHFLSRSTRDMDLVCYHAEKLAKNLADANEAAFVSFRKKIDQPCFRVVNRQDSEDFIDVNPIYGNSMVKDLERRDFTINAIAIQVDSGGKLGKVLDPLNGIRDLEQRFIKVIGPYSFSADPLRILRAVRFAAELGFAIDITTQSAMKDYATLLSEASGERIRGELFKIFAWPESAVFVRLMDELEILEVIFPEINAMKDCEQNEYHHLDVWNHCLAVLETCEYIVHHPGKFFDQAANRVGDNLKSGNRLPLMKMAAMLHDVGKPEARKTDSKSGRIIFHGHDKIGEEIVSEISNRLRMSKQDQEFLRLMVAEHMHLLSLSRPEVKPKTYIKWFRKVKDDIIPLIIIAMADTQNTRGPASSELERDRHIQWSQGVLDEYYSELKQQIESKSFINGNDLIALGMKPGPAMGKVLQKIREAQDAGSIQTREEALSLAFHAAEMER